MNIIESTPINLGNDDCDIVNAFIYKQGNDYFRLHIDFPKSERITNEFSEEEIERMWDEQYPMWSFKVNTWNMFFVQQP